MVFLQAIKMQKTVATKNNTYDPRPKKPRKKELIGFIKLNAKFTKSKKVSTATPMLIFLPTLIFLSLTLSFKMHPETKFLLFTKVL